MKETNIIKFWNNICKEIETMDTHNLNLGIWSLVKKYDTKELNLSKELFKTIYSINQIFDKFSNDKNFCITLNSVTGCSNCGSQNSNIEYINPLIMFDENDILNSNIISKINSIVKNDLNICEKCNYSKDGKIINNKLLTKYRTIINWELPKILCISFELGHQNDLYNKIGLNNISQQNNIIFERMKKYSQNIINLLLEDFII